jgi:hypothetical protein
MEQQLITLNSAHFPPNKVKNFSLMNMRKVFVCGIFEIGNFSIPLQEKKDFGKGKSRNENLIVHLINRKNNFWLKIKRDCSVKWFGLRFNVIKKEIFL